MIKVTLSDKFCKCGSRIEQARLNATKGSAKTCIKCMNSNDVNRKKAIPIISGKTEYSALNFVDEETAIRLHNAQSRAGQSPGSGMKYGVS